PPHAPGLRRRDPRRGRGGRPRPPALAHRPASLSVTAPAAIERTLALLDPDARPDDLAAATRPGYLDLIGGADAPAPTGPAQRLMLTAALPAIYERWWRPALGRAVKGVLGPSMVEEHRIA